jgi:hypothetical protein
VDILLENKPEEILRRCIIASPTSGELWKSVTKKIENCKLKTEDIIQKALDNLLD